MPKIRKDLDDKKEYIINSLLSGEKTPTDLCLELNCKPDTLRARTSKWIPDYKPDYTKKLRSFGGTNKWPSLKDYYDNKGKRCKRNILYRLLIEERGNKCECCNQSSEWMGKFLRLQVDHIDGMCYNNKPDNLRLLCPNCHTQTETFSSKTTLSPSGGMVETRRLERRS